MKFSIVLASRERSQLLVNLVRSIEATTNDLKNIEVLVGIDDDDGESADAAMHIKEWYPADWIRFYSRQRSDHLNRDYLNWLSDKSTGKYVIACNDDCEFRTKDWDVIAENTLEEYLKDKPDGCVYGYLNDNLNDRHGLNYTCFPLVSRKGIEAVGEFLASFCRSWNADIYLWRIWSAVDRIVYINILIAHISYHSIVTPRARDHINHHVANLANNCPDVPTGQFSERIIKAIELAKNQV